MPLLHIKLAEEDNTLRVKASLQNTKKKFYIPLDEIKTKFHLIYKTLEHIKTKNETVFQESIHSLSKSILEPIKNFLNEADHICFSIQPEIVRCTFDLLEWKDKALFLQFPITYTVSNFSIITKPDLEIEDAVLVADKTCDPEGACKSLHNELSDSEFFKIENISVEEIVEKTDDISLLLISAHGDLSNNNTGTIGINKEKLKSSHLEEIDCSLVYFDSCQMGVNVKFLEAFSEEQSTQYYVAPIISNDAGDSSTKTIQFFFDELSKTKSPAGSLFYARKKLFKFYTEKGLSIIKVLNKSFPFRLYEFDMEE
ncbi:MAG: hypothetical protein H7A25_10240 [Leptospiraceae bacterium]|nr:hypothetical protein [Leptospiraceae bacterium]